MDFEFIKSVEDELSKEIISYDNAKEKIYDYFSKQNMSNKQISNIIKDSIDKVLLAKKKNFLSHIKNDDGTIKYTKVYSYEDNAIETLYEAEKRLQSLRKSQLNVSQNEEKNDDLKEIINETNSKMSEEDKSEVEKSIPHYNNIKENITKEEESTVKKVEVSPERRQKLEESKINFNKKKLLIDIAIVAGIFIAAGPLYAVYDTALLATIAYGVKKFGTNPKTKVGKSVFGVLNDIVNLYNPVKEDGGKSK